MIAPRDHTTWPSGGRLAVGDEPRDLAIGRLLYEMEEGGIEVVLPGKGEVPLPTSFGGEDGAWLVKHARGRIPAERDWLRALAADGEEPPPPAGISRTGLREIEVLLAAARRSAAHDLAYAFELLGAEPGRVRADRRLRAFREETNRAVGPALRTRPRFAWRVALIPFVSAESVEDIVAARWRDQLGRYVVLAANSGYAAGRVTFAFRAPAGLDAAAVLASAWPAGRPAPRTEGAGESGRGALPRGEFLALLDGLRFRRAADLVPG